MIYKKWGEPNKLLVENDYLEPRKALINLWIILLVTIIGCKQINRSYFHLLYQTIYLFEVVVLKN